MAMEHLYKECIFNNSNNNKDVLNESRNMKNIKRNINITLEEVLDIIEENRKDW